MQREEGSETERQRERWYSRFVGRRQRSPGLGRVWQPETTKKRWECSALDYNNTSLPNRTKNLAVGTASARSGGPAGAAHPARRPQTRAGKVSGLQGLWKKRRAKKKVDQSQVVPSGSLRSSARRRAALCCVAAQGRGERWNGFGFSGCGLLWTGNAGSGVFSVGSCPLLLFF